MIINKLNITEMSDFIIRFYVFTPKHMILLIDELKIAFRQAISTMPSKINSYVVLYLFERKVIMSLDLNEVPYIYDHILDEKLKKKEEMYKQWKKNHGEENNNEFVVSEKLMTKYVHKFYTTTSFEISNFLMAVYSKRSCAKKLKKKVILNNICSFLSINVKEKIYNKDDLNSKDVVSKEYLAIQDEYSLKMVESPNSESQLHDDLVHVHFDQVFNLLKYTHKNDPVDKK